MTRNGKRQNNCVFKPSVKRAKTARSTKTKTFTFDVWAVPDSTDQQLFESAKLVLVDVLGDSFPRLSRSFKLVSVEPQRSKAAPDWHIATISCSNSAAIAEIEILFGA